MGLSDIYYKKRQYKKGIKLFKRLTDRYSNNSRFAFQLAYFHSLNDNYNKAIEIYRKLLDKTLILNKNIDFQLVGNLIEAYNEKGDYEKSLELIDLFLKDKKNKDIESYVYCNAGNTFLDLEDYKKAIKYYNRALSLKESSNAFFNKALCLREIERYKDSLKCFLKAESLEQNPSLKGKTQNSIGHVYYLLEDYDKALEYFKKSMNNGFKKAKENYTELIKKFKKTIN
jgi:tetratricopeptide (TPR) repeat protein